MSHGMVHHKRYRRRRRKWLKRAGLSVGLMALLAGIALWTVTRPWFLGWQLAPLLAERLGGDVTIDRVEYEGNGKFRASDMTLSVPQIAGEGGTIAKVKEAEVTVDPGALQRGRIRLTNIVLDGLTLRLSEDATKPWLYNFMQLAPEVIRAGDQRMSPKIRIHDAVIEVGRHEAGRYTPVGERRVAGWLEPTEAKDGWYEFELSEIDEQGTELGDAGIQLQGKWNKKTNEEECLIKEVTLDDRMYRMLPIMVRRQWDRMALSGRVKQMHLHWKPSEGPGVEFAV
ncbi:MAG TPA: hypothetical protein VG711_07585, partial [Phycisphaerales bacterium]|nr:hypothetical protein [Phycisphaerales bacterium]